MSACAFSRCRTPLQTSTVASLLGGLPPTSVCSSFPGKFFGDNDDDDYHHHHHHHAGLFTCTMNNNPHLRLILRERSCLSPNLKPVAGRDALSMRSCCHLLSPQRPAEPKPSPRQYGDSRSMYPSGPFTVPSISRQDFPSAVIVRSCGMRLSRATRASVNPTPRFGAWSLVLPTVCGTGGGSTRGHVALSWTGSVCEAGSLLLETRRGECPRGERHPHGDKLPRERSGRVEDAVHTRE